MKIGECYMKVELAENHQYIDNIVEIHMGTFTGFFLTFLGRGFLKTLYRGFIDHPYSGIFLAIDGDKPVGFCAYSEDLSGFYKYLIKRRLPVFVWYAIGAFFRNPRILFRLLRALTYSRKSKREEPYIELSSIGVLPTEKNKGIGSTLLKKICDKADSNKFAYIKLETDRDNNEYANYFYKKNGFVLAYSYETFEGRYMNEYRYYLRNKNEENCNCDVSCSLGR